MNAWEEVPADEANARWQAWQHADETALARATREAWRDVQRGEYTEADVKLVEAALRRAGEL